MIDKWLERAGTQLIYLCVQGAHGPIPNLPRQACLQLQINVLRKYSGRIYHLEGVTPHLLQEMSGSRLRGLQCLIFDLDRSDLGNCLLNLPSFAPNLRRLAVDEKITELRPSQTSIFSLHTWNHLTHLTTRVSGYKKWMRILEACPNLQCALFHYSHTVSLSEDAFSTLLNLPSLYTLTIVLVDPHPINLQLFRHLELPSLNTFRLGSFHQPSFTFNSEIEHDLHLAYQQISGIRCLSLFFDSLMSRLNWFAGEFLPNFLYIEELDIQDCFDLAMFFFELNQFQKYGQVPSLPRLQVLSLDIRQDCEFDFSSNGDFVEFVQSRSSSEYSSAYYLPFQVVVYVNKDATHVYAPMVEKVRSMNLPVYLTVWDEETGHRGSRWKYRLDAGLSRVAVNNKSTANANQRN
ncbi:hypothetical protein BDZ97DRAFT_1931470 [Flammula alnicola]|nr:hypothetical protein BDZ97DRAFT_1931470 [Flammula alnicola]